MVAQLSFPFMTQHGDALPNTEAMMAGAFLREWPHWHVASSTALPTHLPTPGTRQLLVLPLPQSGLVLHVGLAHQSCCDRHRFALPLLACGDNGCWETLSLAELATALVRELPIGSVLRAAEQLAIVQRITQAPPRWPGPGAAAMMIFQPPNPMTSLPANRVCCWAIRCTPAPRHRSALSPRDAAL